MSVTNRIGRPMLAAMFIRGGADQLRNPETKVDTARTVTDPIQARADDLPIPEETVDLVRINGGVQVVAGSLLALNKMPRIAALALAGSLVPTTLAGHRFWEIDDEQERAQQRAHFLKNVAMLGGLVIAAGDTGSRPSAAWQARKAVDDAAGEVSDQTRRARKAIDDATHEVTGRTRRARRSTSGLADAASGRVAESLSSARSTAAPALHDAGETASDALESASELLAEAVDRAQPALETAAGETRTRLRDLRKAARPVEKKLRKRSGRLAASAARAGTRSRTAARNAADRGVDVLRSAAA